MDHQQRRCMRNLIQEPIIGTDEFRNHYFTPFTRDDNDVCNFRGVRCSEGVMERFMLKNRRHEYRFNELHCIQTQWLPSTLQFVYMDAITLLNGWQSQNLPRELRFFHVSFISVRTWTDVGSIDLRKLPSKIEELHSFFGWYCGKIVLTNLPSTLRTLQIFHAETRAVYYDAMRIPIGLEYMRFVRNRDASKVPRMVNIGVSKGNLKFHTKGAMSIENSRFLEWVHEGLMDIN